MALRITSFPIETHGENVAYLARTAGAPLYKGAGVDLLKTKGQRVKRGEPLYRIHAELLSDFAFAKELAAEASGFAIGRG